ncbi:putative Hydroxymethylbilane synthase [Rhodotorula taiwanensis]|uniref:Porphobilinogen deaminase n=1 Tax=Rhodotorula taiwanensis TaxID=741276 RepID=A0A2S5B4G8_9BASI|nr:putative Hydroxymethylbilane synthase [Rhodotorula taiwanensis]
MAPPTLPPDHPPIPTTSSAQFPTVPPPACPMSSQLAQTRPIVAATPTEQNGHGQQQHTHKYAGQVFTLGTRNSKLAMVQTEIVRRDLEERWPGCEIRILGMTTLGDNVQTQPLYTFGGKALWTKELEVALLDGDVDAIVHSLKDVPTEFPPGCELGAVLEREDPTDALVVKDGLPYMTLDEIPDGSVIGTSSVRRVAQLRRKFPRLKFADVRGNLGTRLRKLDAANSNYTALILASAGLIRIGLGHRITASVAAPTLYHAVGQGAIGVEIRAGDRRARDVIGSLECWKTSWRTRAERMMLKVLEGGCSVPVGCETKITEVFVRGGEGDASSLTSASSRRARPPVPIDTHGVVVTRDEGAMPLSPDKVSDFPPPGPISPVISPSSPRSSHASSSHLPVVASPPKPTIDLSKIGQPDETTGIPDGHPPVNPAHICPVTGKMLPGAPRSPRLNGVHVPLSSMHQRHDDADDLAAGLQAHHACTHRPGMPPSCPSDARLTTHHATLTLTGTITSLSGTRAVLCTLARRVHSVRECEQLGADVARELIEGGGDEILTELGRHVKEVGTSPSLDGQPIPVSIPPFAPLPPPEAPGAIDLPASSAAVPIAVAVASPGRETGAAAVSSMNGGGGAGLAKSPHSRTVFKQGEVCLRPAGW